MACSSESTGLMILPRRPETAVYSASDAPAGRAPSTTWAEGTRRRRRGRFTGGGRLRGGGNLPPGATRGERQGRHHGHLLGRTPYICSRLLVQGLQRGGRLVGRARGAGRDDGGAAGLAGND